jgi:hypothetical protein
MTVRKEALHHLIYMSIKAESFPTYRAAEVISKIPVVQARLVEYMSTLESSDLVSLFNNIQTNGTD